MARFNRRVDGDGYYVTSIFTRHGITRKVTYQTHSRAIQILTENGVRSGDEIPRALFFDLLEEGLLFTHGSGPGQEIADGTRQAARIPISDQRDNRRQIPLDVTSDLLNQDGTFISFGRFKLQYGGPTGYSDDILRPAYKTLNDRFETKVIHEQPAPSVQHQTAPVEAMPDKPANLSGRFDAALNYAAVIHAGQFRKGTGIPYIAHLLGVVSIALENGADEDQAIGALLHDAGEDAGGLGRIEDIRIRFGNNVATIVEGCTDTVIIPKPPWRDRKQKYIAHLESASASILLVSAADKLHNARAILRDLRQHGDNLWSRFNGGKEGSLWYYRSLVTAFKLHGKSDLIDELDRVVTEIENLAGHSQP